MLFILLFPIIKKTNIRPIIPNIQFLLFSEIYADFTDYPNIRPIIHFLFSKKTLPISPIIRIFGFHAKYSADYSDYSFLLKILNNFDSFSYF